MNLTSKDNETIKKGFHRKFTAPATFYNVILQNY